MNSPTHTNKATASTAPAWKSQAFCIRNYPRQRGVVLFLTLMALLAMSLAAVALIRSVDTSAMIVGNLAQQRAATASANQGIEAGMIQLNAVQAAYEAANPNTDITTDPAHPLNNTNLAIGYHSAYDPAVDVRNAANWGAGKSVTVTAGDASGNRVEYLIQRMCRTENAPISQADCLLSSASADENAKNVVSATQVCSGACVSGGQPAQIRITVRSTGQNTGAISFVQAFIF